MASRPVAFGVVHPADQFVGLAGHGRNDHRDLVAGIDLAFDMARDIADAADVGDGGPAEFHHDARHGSRMPLAGLELRAEVPEIEGVCREPELVRRLRGLHIQ